MLFLKRVAIACAGGLGILLWEQFSSLDFEGMSLTLFVFIILTFAVDMVRAQVRKTFR